MFRILIVDDHNLFRGGLNRLLQGEPDLQVVGDFPTVDQGLAALQSLDVDLVLLDYDLGKRTGLEFFESARQGGYTGKILFVTAGMKDSDILHVLKQGASGIFLKHSSPSDLLDAIRTVESGDNWVDPRSAHSLVVAALTPQQHSESSISLTDRERAVLSSVFNGLSNKEIAAKLNTSEGTIKAVLQQLFSKMEVRSRSQLVRIALENRETYGLTLDDEQ